MKEDNKKLIKKIQVLKKKTRNRDIRIKLELFILGLKLGNISEACSRRGFGRTFYYKWWKRFCLSNYKLKSLQERSRRPKNKPHQISSYWENKIREIHSLGYGALMIQALLKRENARSFSTSTINHVINLRRKKIKATPKKKLNSRRKRYELYIPGQRVQVDVKYVPKLIDGKRYYNYVAIDECTRWRFARIYPELNPKMTVYFLDELEAACPFPLQTIQTDNGFEFCQWKNPENSNHPMKEWCEKKDIKHRRIPPGAKELNGKVERSHRIDEQYFYWKAPYNSLGSLNNALDEWINYYNSSRPHMSLNWQTPTEMIIKKLSELPQEKLEGHLEEARLKFLMYAPKLYWEKYGSYPVKLAA